MNHDYGLKGLAFQLRPVGLQDAAFIVEARTSDPDRTRLIHSISADLDKQRLWITQYLEREGDYYWVIERLDTIRPEGLVAVYNVNMPERTAEWGRWVLRSGSLAAVESAWLVYRMAFEVLALNSVYCLTVADNARVVSFHESCGLVCAGRFEKYCNLGGRPHDAIKHICASENWPAVREKLEPIVRLTASRIRRA